MKFTVLFCVLALTASNVQAQEMKAQEAKAFVLGRMFAFDCFEGSRGAGKILSDGSAIGSVRLRGGDAEREAYIPSGTLFIQGEEVCAHVAEASFKPCFTVVRTGPDSFRGHMTGYENVSCEFRHVKEQAEVGGHSLKVERSSRRAAIDSAR